MDLAEQIIAALRARNAAGETYWGCHFFVSFTSD